MDIKEVALSAITPYARNTKKHDKKQIKTSVRASSSMAGRSRWCSTKITRS